MAQPAERARHYRDLALNLEGRGWIKTAEKFHQTAGLILAEIPLGGSCDRERVRYAVSLAGNLALQCRHDDARSVLVAALALAEGCLGTDDPDTQLLRRRLGSPRERSGQGGEAEGS